MTRIKAAQDLGFRLGVGTAVADITEKVRGLFDEREDAPFGPDEAWVDGEPYIRAYTLLDFLETMKVKPE